MSTISKLDVLAPFEIWEIPFGDRTIKFFEPLLLEPEILPPEGPTDRTYLVVDVPELNISVHADNREDLLDFIHSEIRFIWRHIVLVPDNAQDRESNRIKRNFLAIAEVIDG